MTKGIVYIAFGNVYDKLAAHTIAYSRQFTDMPICVFTNLKNRHKKWDEIKNVQFKYLPWEQKQNREVKTNMIQYTPFDLTLHLDCDSVIQNRGIEEAFERLENKDLLLCINMNWPKGHRVLNIYRKMMKQTNVQLPITIYYGGFQLFRKNERVYNFYLLWNKYWSIEKGRDMPALNCAIQNSDVTIQEFPEEVTLFAEHKLEDAIIQHRYGRDFVEKFGLFKWASWKPFDTDKTDFTWVDF